MSDTAIDGDIKPSTVASYLRRHPDFLGAYPDVADALVLPAQRGAATSLAVRQLRGLREKNAELESRLREFTLLAAENEGLMRRVHGLVLGVMQARGLDAVLRTLERSLREDFQLEQVRLLFFGALQGLPDEPWLLREPGGASALPEFASYLEHGEPVAGRLAQPKLDRLFGADVGNVRSAALMRVGPDALLAFGSSDADHFHPGMGTLFLDTIASTVAAALARARDGA